MPSSIFGPNPIQYNLDGIRSMIGGNPQALFESMVRSNPQFASFVQMHKGKTAEQAFKEYGLDFNQFRGLFS